MSKTMQAPPSHDPTWQQDHYTIKQKIVSMGRKFFIEDESGNQIGFCKGTHLKLKDEFTVYRDKTKSEVILRIKQEQIVDDWGTYGVYDSTTELPVGYLHRKMVESFWRDEWSLKDANKNKLGVIQEDKLWKAVLRRWFPIPKVMYIKMNDQELINLRRKYVGLGTWWVDCKADPNKTIDRRLAVASAILMEAVEQFKQ